MYINKSPYSHNNHRQKQQYAQKTVQPNHLYSMYSQVNHNNGNNYNNINIPTNTQISNKNIKKNKQNTVQNVNEYANLKLNKKRISSDIDIDLQCDEVLMVPNLQHDLLCNQQINFKTTGVTMAANTRQLLQSPNYKMKATQQQQQQQQQQQRYGVMMQPNKDKSISPRAGLPITNRKQVPPINIDLLCTQQLLPNQTANNIKTKQENPAQNNSYHHTDNTNNINSDANDLMLVYHRFSKILLSYQQQLQRRQQKIQYLQAQYHKNGHKNM